MPQTHNASHLKRTVLLVLLAVLIAIWFVGFAFSAAAQTVTLQATAQPNTADLQQAGGLTLGMVARIDDATDDQRHALASLVLVPTSASALPPQIRLEDLQKTLQHAGVNLARLTLRGFQTCVLQTQSLGHPAVSESPRTEPSERPSAAASPSAPATAAATPTQPIDVADAESVQHLIEHQLRQALQLPPDQVVFTFDGRDLNTLQQSTLGVRFRIEPLGDARLGRMSVRVHRTAGWGDAQTQTVGVRVAWRTPVLVAARNIDKHERLNETNLTLQTTLIDRPLDGQLFDLSAAQGAVADAFLRAGEPIRSTDLGQPVLVKRGQPVTVTIARGGFRLSTTGFAEHDAALHETVAVRSDARRSRDTPTFQATVTGPGKVAVQSPPTPAHPPAADAPQLADAAVANPRR